MDKAIVEIESISNTYEADISMPVENLRVSPFVRIISILNSHVVFLIANVALII